MTTCPCCDTDNIEGVDECQRCGQPLAELYLTDPKTLVERSLLQDRVSSLKPHPPVVVNLSSPVGDVLRQMVSASIGCVLVADDAGELVGIFSERDALRRIGVAAESQKQRPVAEFMTDDPQCLLGNSKVAFAVHRMDVGGYRHVPIVDESGQAVGIISVRDILHYITDVMSAAASA